MKYRLHHRFDLRINDGWTLQSTGPDNADANHRPENVLFGQGAKGTSMAVVLDRDKGGLWSGEGRNYAYPFPNFHASRAVVRFDAPVAGGWPALWKRPFGGSGTRKEGEIDDLEVFGLHGAKATLHTTPYDARHRFVSSPKFPTLAPHVGHLIETELTPTGFREWVNKRLVWSITPAQYNAATGTDSWAAMFGDEGKQWYYRLTMQGGSNGAGRVPAAFTGPWKFTVDELAVGVPV